MNSAKFPMLICIGGFSTTNGSKLSPVSYYDKEKLQWRYLPELSTPRSWFDATIYKQSIIVCGGYERVGTNEFVSLSSVEMFDFGTQRWTRLEDMPYRLSSCAVATLGDNIYVAGGNTDMGNPSSVFMFLSMRTGKWTVLKNLESPRSDAKLIAINDQLMLLSGGTVQTEVYDPQTERWIVGPSTKHPHSCFGATIHRGDVFVCSSKGFEVFDTRNRQWSELPRLNIGENVQLVSYGEHLLAVGGARNNHDGQGSDNIYKFDFSARE